MGKGLRRRGVAAAVLVVLTGTSLASAACGGGGDETADGSTTTVFDGRDASDGGTVVEGTEPSAEPAPATTAAPSTTGKGSPSTRAAAPSTTAAAGGGGKAAAPLTTLPAIDGAGGEFCRSFGNLLFFTIGANGGGRADEMHRQSTAMAAQAPAEVKPDATALDAYVQKLTGPDSLEPVRDHVNRIMGWATGHCQDITYPSS